MERVPRKLTEISPIMQKKIIDGIEYILEHQGGSGCEVSDVMKAFDISFEEYRVVMNLCMPAMRQYSTKLENRQRLALLKKEHRELIARYNILEDQLNRLRRLWRLFSDVMNEDEPKVTEITEVTEETEEVQDAGTQEETGEAEETRPQE